MSTTRRDFLRQGSCALALPFLHGSLRPFLQETAKVPKSLLMLGGTAFLGPEIVTAAIARGHKVTLFNRGKTNPKLFPDVEKLIGDREGNLSALEGKSFDAVIDTSAYFPRWVDLVAGALKDRVGHYIFISSVSVYPKMDAEDTDETTPVGTISDPKMEKVTNESYGPLKALCEQAAERAYPGKTTNVRPGLIVGPNDPTDRFTYWPVRVKAGGDVLAPGSPKHTVQYIDVRDLGEWIVKAIEDGTFGIYNALGPKTPLAIGDLLKTCKDVSGSDANFVWANAEVLSEHGVRPWADMPLWIPPGEGKDAAPVCSNARAVAKGMTFRPVADTVKDTLAWFETLPKDRRFRTGIRREREKEVLTKLLAEKK